MKEGYKMKLEYNSYGAKSYAQRILTRMHVSKYMYQTLWTVEGAGAAAGLFSLSCRLPEEF